VAFLETNEENNKISNEAKLLPSPNVLQNIRHYKMKIINQWLSYNIRIMESTVGDIKQLIAFCDQLRQEKYLWKPEGRKKNIRRLIY
jgi:hypothetical protein